MKLFLSFLGIFACSVIMCSTSLADWTGPKPIDHIEPGNAIVPDRIIYCIPIEVCENHKNAHECAVTCKKSERDKKGCSIKCSDKYAFSVSGDRDWNTQVADSCRTSTK